MSKGERNRDLESAQLSQMEKEKNLSDLRSLRDFLDKTADRAFQGELAAQTR